MDPLANKIRAIPEHRAAVAPCIFGVTIREATFPDRISTIPEHRATVARRAFGLALCRATFPDRISAIPEHRATVAAPRSGLAGPLPSMVAVVDVEPRWIPCPQLHPEHQENPRRFRDTVNDRSLWKDSPRMHRVTGRPDCL
jgi:hypothetical protein